MAIFEGRRRTDDGDESVVHFEMGARDRARMAKFYSGAFGWKTTQLGPEMGNYITVQTTDTSENGFPREPGRINGGFYERTREDQGTTVVIAVDNIRDAMKKVAAAGGKVIGGQKPGEPDDIPASGCTRHSWTRRATASACCSRLR